MLNTDGKVRPFKTGQLPDNPRFTSYPPLFRMHQLIWAALHSPPPEDAEDGPKAKFTITRDYVTDIVLTLFISGGWVDFSRNSEFPEPYQLAFGSTELRGRGQRFTVLYRYRTPIRLVIGWNPEDAMCD